MRERKLRAYYPIDDKYVWHGTILDITAIDTRLCHDLLIFELSTGLKDENLVEIYEGDIVDIIHPCWSEKCITEFCNGSFVFKTINYNENQNVVIPGYTFMQEKWKVKVIGNIHQNPELLK